MGWWEMRVAVGWWEMRESRVVKDGPKSIGPLARQYWISIGPLARSAVEMLRHPGLQPGLDNRPGRWP